MPKSRKPNERQEPMYLVTGRWLAKVRSRSADRIVRFWQDLTLARGARHYRALAAFCVICIVAGLGASLIWRSTVVRYAAEQYRAAFLGQEPPGSDPLIPGFSSGDLISHATPAVPVDTPPEPTGDSASGNQPAPDEPTAPVTTPPAGPSSPSPAVEQPVRPDLSTQGRPITGPIISQFGWQYSSTFADWRFHPGVDIQAAEGTAVRAALSGRVGKVDDSFELGLHCVVDHGGGISTVYGNLKTCAVQVGQDVQRGAQIGTIGVSAQSAADLGPHLHFELLDQGSAIDPAPYL